MVESPARYTFGVARSEMLSSAGAAKARLAGAVKRVIWEDFMAD
jgi:hypothetical protein